MTHCTQLMHPIHDFSHISMLETNTNSSDIMDVGTIDEASAQSVLSSFQSIISDSSKIGASLFDLASNQPPIFSRFLVESSIFPTICQKIRSSPCPALFLGIRAITSSSETLSLLACSKGLLVNTLKMINNPNNQTQHGALKLLRSFIKTSHVLRCVIFGLGTFNSLLTNFQNGILNPNLAYAIRTVVEFSLRDPVYSGVGYQKIGKHLPNRRFVINYFKQNGGNTHASFKVSHFMKYGNTWHLNRSLWLIMNIALGASDPAIVFQGLRMIHALSSNPNNCHEIIEFTPFLKLRNSIMSSGNAEMVLAYYTSIVNIHYFCSEFYKNKIFKAGFFNDAFTLISNENEQIVSLGAKIITNGIEWHKHPLLQICQGKSFLALMWGKAKAACYNTSADIVRLFLAIIDSSNLQERQEIVNPQIVEFLISFCESADSGLVESILTMFHALIIGFGPDFVKAIATPEFVETLDALSENDDKKISEHSSSILDVISSLVPQ